MYLHVVAVAVDIVVVKALQFVVPYRMSVVVMGTTLYVRLSVN